jgi:DNA-binding response OmpR family regulator
VTTDRTSSASGPPDELILRAELFYKGRRIVAHTMEVSATSALIRTDESIRIGDRLFVRLSFPGLLEPFDIEGHVASKHAPAARGEPAGITLALVFVSESDEMRFRDLIEGNASPEEAATGRMVYRVLLVEDSETTRDVMLFEARRHCGSNRQLHLDFAENAEEGWEMLQRGGYHLAIIDHYLPGMTGTDLVKRVRVARAVAGMPILAVSAGGASVREAMVAAGADVFLDKPVGVRTLFATLDRLLAHLGHAPNPRVLVIDDSELFLDLASAALMEAGFQVLCAPTLADVERLTAARPDLVLVDVRMPELFGDDLAAMLRGIRGIHVPILLISSLDAEELKERAARAEVDGFISKALGIDHVVDRVRDLIGFHLDA